jgi:hypothetical protein
MSFKGITQGLRVLNQPIDALARLPQDQIIAMSQQPAGSPNRIPPDYVATILKAKADMAQAAANMQAMQQPMQPSIVEQSMAINAQAEAPQQAPMDTGVASLPVPEEMYGSDYAGGGIVAFDEGGMAGTFDSFMPSEPSGEPLVEPDIPEELVGKIGLPQVYGIKEGRYGRTKDEILKSFGVKPSAPAARPAPTVSAEAAPTAPAAPAAPAKAPARESGIAAIPKGAASAAKPDYLTKLQEMLKKAGVTDTDQEDLAAIQQGRSKLEEDKSDALRMAIVRAGLGAAAETSPYALSNLAKGFSQGVESYEKSTKEIKAEKKEYDKIERDLRKASNLRKRGEVEKALDLEEKAEDREIKLRGLEYQRISATKQSPEEIRMNFFRNDPEGFKRYMESQRSGFETADISRVKAGLEDINNRLLGMKPGPERDKLIQERQRLFDMLVPKPTAIAGGSVDRNNPLLKGG